MFTLSAASRHHLQNQNQFLSLISVHEDRIRTGRGFESSTQVLAAASPLSHSAFRTAVAFASCDVSSQTKRQQSALTARDEAGAWINPRRERSERRTLRCSAEGTADRGKSGAAENDHGEVRMRVEGTRGEIDGAAQIGEDERGEGEGNGGGETEDFERNAGGEERSEAIGGSAEGLGGRKRKRKMKVLVCAGDVMGDDHAARLVAALLGREKGEKGERGEEWKGGEQEEKEEEEEWEVYAVAGPRSEAAGATLLGSNHGMSSIGLFEALRFVPRSLLLLAAAKRFVRHHKPHAVVLVDYPGFNIPLANYVLKNHAATTRVVYYIPPNEWLFSASSSPRIASVAACHVVIATYPDEAEFFSSVGATVRLFGHPLVDTVTHAPSREQARTQLAIPATAKVVALLPASRPQETSFILPTVLSAAVLLNQQMHDTEDGPPLFLLPLADESLRAPVQEQLRAFGMHTCCRVLEPHQSLQAMAAADAAVTKSGSVTLQLALLKVPQVVLYRLSPATALLARLLVRFRHPFYSLVNLVLLQPLVPEFIQEEATPEAIAGATKQLLVSESARSLQLVGYEKLPTLLGTADVSLRVAQCIKEQARQGNT
ncbi:hypothetical protein CLOM_g19038 [Closterium sp. NIES-68]|nr:hypothetical protein CLOM_g19038 [Closterium sp. NIES-68]GJP62705.1 hypothetical protein CLOP_g19737 [Closterium sp. NIES-67]